MRRTALLAMEQQGDASPGADCPRPAPSLVDSIKAKPEEIRVWWRDLTAVFDKSFLALICSVYFLQGCGNLPTLVTKYYIKNSLERTCDEGAVAASATSSGGCGQGCHVGLALTPSQQTLLLTTVGLPWNYKIVCKCSAFFDPAAPTHLSRALFQTAS